MKAFRRILLGLFFMGGTAGGLAACNTNGTSNQGNSLERRAAQSELAQLEQSDPIPSYKSSMQRKNLIDVENVQANATQTTTFFMQMGAPDPVFTCASIALPLAYDDQLTNPSQIIRQGFGNGHYADGTVSQVDPTGIYAGGNSTGTNVICVDANGKGYVAYWEGNVLTFTYGATWDYTHHRVQLVGQPTANIRTSNG